jgi:tetratricopeptide (TPR) repeat protein
MESNSFLNKNILNFQDKKFNEALNFFDQKKYIEAKKALIDLRINKNNIFDINYFLGVIEGILGNSIEACILFKKAIEIKPKFADTYYNLGVTYLKLEDVTNAELNLRTAIELKPNNIKFIIILCIPLLGFFYIPS